MYALPLHREAMSLLKESLPLLLPFFIFVVFTLKWCYINSNTQRNRPPSPPKLPIIGNIHQLSSCLHRSLRSLAQKHGPLMLLHLGSKPLLVVSTAYAASEVLKTHDTAFAGRPKIKFAGRLLYGVKDMTFCSYGEYWRQVRSICVIHLLSNRKVHSFRSVIEEELALMMEKIRQSCFSTSTINVGEIFSDMTNDIVCRVALGKKYSGEEGGRKFRDLFVALVDLVGTFNVGDYFPWLEWVNHFTGLDAQVRQVAKDFDEYLEHLVEEEMNRQKSGNKGNDGYEGKQQQNLIQILLEIQRTKINGFDLDRDCIKAIILDMLIGGTDTTYLVLLWAMAELQRHKNVMTKLQNDVRGIVGLKSGITDDDLEKMKYLKAVIKETLRLHPPVPLLVPRESTEYVKLMDYDIEKGTQVIVNAWAIGRDPSLWEEPEEFRPERFLNSFLDFKGRNFQYIPFGSGRRSCPGSTFGLAIVELTLANLIHTFNFALPDGVRPEHLDMTEDGRIVAYKKVPLKLVATPI